MAAPTSSTSSSESPRSPAISAAGAARRRANRRTAIAGTLWIIAALAALDAAINILFPMPADPAVAPGSLARYFDHGRSIEGKLARMIGPDEASSAPLVRAAWLRPENWQWTPAPDESVERPLRIAVYGMSFSNQIAREMNELEPGMQLRLVAGPAAPPNRSFAAFEADRASAARGRVDVAVLAILGSTVPKMGTLSGLTWSLESPACFTFPTYTVDAAGALTEIRPLLATQDEFRAAFRDDPARWSAFREQLREHDAFFDPLVFDRTILDRSAIVRLVRRAYAMHAGAKVQARVLTPDGLRDDHPSVIALRRLVEEFAAHCREDGTVPVLLLVDDRGMSDFVHRALEGVIRARNIACLSTHEVANPADSGNFLGDGHFREPVSREIAARLRALIAARLGP